MALVVKINHEQQRVSLDPLPLIARGADMEPVIQRSGAWVEPFTKRILLEPYCLLADWRTSNSGNFAKLPLSAFSASGGWEERSHPGLIEGPWLGLPDLTSTGTLITSATYSKNQGFYLAWHNYDPGGATLILRAGWNSSASIAGGVGVAIYSDGTIQVYKGGTLVDEGKISGSKTKGTKPGAFTEVIMLPFAGREILFHSPTNGDAFGVVFDDIEADASDPEITPAQKFWVEAVSGGAQVMVAPLKFPASGYVTSVRQSFMEAPATGETLSEWANQAWVGTGPHAFNVNGWPAYVGLQSASAVPVQWDGTTFTPDGTKDEVRLKVTLTTDNTGYTPALVGGQVSYPGAFALTDDSAVQTVTSSVMQCSLTVPDDPFGAEVTLLFRDPAALEATVPNLRKGSSHPVQILDGTQVIFDGVATTPDYQIGPSGLAERLTMRVVDRMALTMQAISAETIPLDGVPFSDGVSYLAQWTGIDASAHDISTTTLRLDRGQTGEKEDWAVALQAGDSPGSTLDELIGDLAGTWVYGIRPTATGTEFYAKDPTDLGTTAAVTVYLDAEDSEALGGHTGLDIARYVIRDVSFETLAPEATEVRVTGTDSRTGRMIQAVKRDTAAETVATAPASRPLNWVGRRLRYGIEQPKIRSQAVANEACNLLFDRLTVVREMAEWTGSFLKNPSDVPLWRGSNVRIYGHGTYRIISFAGDWMCQDGVVDYSQFTYQAEKVAEEPE